MCRWMRDTSIVLRWEFNWWPDGIHQEDAAVELVVDENPLDRIDIGALLGRPMSRPLREEISDQIVTMASTFTGKSV